MAIMHLICGLPGAGKTTLAKQLASEFQAIRFCPDEWILELLPAEYSTEERDRLRTPVESLQWQMGKQLLKQGLDVVLEWGTWAKSERVLLRDEARKVCALAKLYYLDIPKDELIRRVEARNQNVPAGSFHIDVNEMKSWFDLFQEPLLDEMQSFDEYEIITSCNR